MDYNKIGEFIAAERKAKKLTQAKLAEKLFISEKTVSKWENGGGIPDTTLLPRLCEIFEISVNELLNGQRLSSENYAKKADEKMLELQKVKEEGDKKLLTMEIVIGCLSAMFLFSLTLIAAYVDMEVWLKITLIAVGFVVGITGFSFALRIEQVAGYYECAKCGNKHVPKYSQVYFAMHVNRTRYMKCPKCNKWSWQKKVIK